MKLSEYKRIMKKPLRLRTIIFLLKSNEVLLGLKKRGFGKGYLLGIGGKVEDGETIEEGLIRELAEEINVKSLNPKKVGVINYYFPHIEDESWNMQVHFFITQTWEGDPKESEEIKPEWFDKENIPYDRMWDDAQYWLPQILTGQRIEAEFIYSKELKVTDYEIKPLT